MRTSNTAEPRWWTGAASIRSFSENQRVASARGANELERERGITIWPRPLGAGRTWHQYRDTPATPISAARSTISIWSTARGVVDAAAGQLPQTTSVVAGVKMASRPRRKTSRRSEPPQQVATRCSICSTRSRQRDQLDFPLLYGGKQGGGALDEGQKDQGMATLFDLCTPRGAPAERAGHSRMSPFSRRPISAACSRRITRAPFDRVRT